MMSIHLKKQKMKNNDASNSKGLGEVFSCISKKANTPKEKYNQLKKDFENLTNDA